MSVKWNNKRPMAPHLQVWKWHPAMLSSILHRASAIVAYVGLIIVTIGIFYLSNIGSLPLEFIIFSPIGLIGFGVFIFAFTFMALAQVRHAIWNKGSMMDPVKNNTLSYLMIIIALIWTFCTLLMSI